MEKIKKLISLDGKDRLYLGHSGDDGFVAYEFDVDKMLATISNTGSFSVMVKRATDTIPYPASKVKYNKDRKTVTWTVTDVETSVVGYGSAQLVYTCEGIIVGKSNVYETCVKESLDDNGTIATPNPEKGWVDKVIQAADSVYQAVDKYPQISPEGYWMVYNPKTGLFENTGVKAKGLMDDEQVKLLYSLLLKCKYTSDPTEDLQTFRYIFGMDWKITNELSRVTTDNNAAFVEKGGRYTAKLTADPGYALTTGLVTIKMGDKFIPTSTVYKDGVIDIPSVTGDVIIYAAAEPV